MQTVSARQWVNNRFVRRHGGLITLSEYTGRERDVLAYCRKVIQTTHRQLEQLLGSSLDRLDFGFLPSRQANAFVVRGNRRHLIGICVGLPIRIKRMLDRAMKLPDFLPDYMTARERPEWSWRYLGMIVEHAYLHEAAHALRGHFAYLDRGGSSPRHFCLDERTRQQGQYIELDADLHALDLWADITRAAADFPSPANLREDLYFQRLLTQLLFYQALDVSNVPIAGYGGLDHPPPVHRSMLLDGAMLASSRSIFGLERKDVEDAHGEAHWEASVAARAAGLTRNRWWGSSGARRGDASYARRFRYYVDVVEPRLDAFGKGLPDDLV